jgi:hypothetical protein
MGKDKLKKEGELPLVLKCDAAIYRKSMEIIANHEAALAQHAGIDSFLMIFSYPLVSSSLIYRKTWSLMLIAHSCAGVPLNNSSKKKARWIGPKVIVDNETIIKKTIYMTWLKDPSSLVSKRRRVGEFQEDTGQLKLAHRLKKAQATIVET